MKIMLTNDDGIYAAGLWALAAEVAKVAKVVVVAPDREQSAVGTAITLFSPLRAQLVRGDVPGVETYAVAGTPGDCVILGLRKLAGPVDLVISGINHGPNVGSDVLISGTVGGALQAYLQGLPAMAISVDRREKPDLSAASKLAALLVNKFISGALPRDILLNVNVPDLPASQIKGITITEPASQKYASVIHEGLEGKKGYYWIDHHVLDAGAQEKPGTDVRALFDRLISITPLHIHVFKDMAFCADGLCPSLYRELAAGDSAVMKNT